MGTHAVPNLPEQREHHLDKVAHDLQIPSDEIMIGLLELSRDCIKILGIDGTLDFINCGGIDASAMRIFSEVQGKYWWSLWPKHTQEMVRQSFERARRGDEVAFSAECPTIRGNVRRWSVSLIPMRACDGTIVGVLCKSRDLDKQQGTN